MRKQKDPKKNSVDYLEHNPQDFSVSFLLSPVILGGKLSMCKVRCPD